MISVRLLSTKGLADMVVQARVTGEWKGGGGELRNITKAEPLGSTEDLRCSGFSLKPLEF